MVSFSPEAADFVRQRGEPVRLELAPPIRGLMSFQEPPTVRFGAPHDRENYLEAVLAGVLVYIPRALLRMDRDVRLAVSSFLWWKWVVCEGWAII
jgi:hypothetical protein